MHSMTWQPPIAATGPGLPPGRIWRRESGRLRYLVFVPPGAGPDAPVLVSVHGVSRNAEDHARAFAPIADHAGAILVAPAFDATDYKGYQRLAARGRPGGAGLALQEILAEVRQDTGCRTRDIHLFGYSGGGQFAHRFAMAWPEQVKKVAVASAGWYTLPDPAAEYPAGLRTQARHPWRCRPADFLRIPMLVAVGDRDTAQDDNLRRRAELDARQGTNRLERARRFTECMREAARCAGVPAHIEFCLLTNVAHSFADCMQVGNLGTRIEQFFFGAPATRVPVSGASQ